MELWKIVQINLRLTDAAANTETNESSCKNGSNIIFLLRALQCMRKESKSKRDWSWTATGKGNEGKGNLLYKVK